MEHCGCGGSWEGTMDREECVKRLRVLERVSGVYGLRMLAKVSREVLDGI